MNGKRITGTKQQLMLKTLTARAAAGDVRAIRMLIDLVLLIFGPEDRGGDQKQLSAQDRQLFEQLLARIEPNPDLNPKIDNPETDDD